MNFWTGKNVLITGGTGSLGQALVPALLDRGVRRLVVFSRGEHRQQEMQVRWPEKPDGPMRYLIGDVRSRDRLRRALHGVDAVIHAAALKVVPVCERNVIECVQTNILGTVNLVESAIDAGVTQVVTVSTDKACLDSQALVWLDAKRRARIIDVVSDGAPRSVLCMDNGRLVSRPITAVYKNELAGRKFVRISYVDAPKPRDRGRGVILTEDHKIATPDGWKAAGLLRTGETILSGEPMPNHRQSALLVGCLLGDAHISPNGKDGVARCEIVFGHASKQRAWLDATRRALNGLNPCPIRRDRQRFETFRLATSVHATVLRSRWYKRGKKVVPRAIARYLRMPECLAAWLMDDGTRTGGTGYGITLCTHGFSESTVRWLARTLTDAGIASRACRQRQYWVIKLNRHGAKALCSKVGRFVPDSLRYKVTCKAPPYDAASWDLGPALPTPVRCVVERKATGRPKDYVRSTYYPRNRKTPRYVFCLGVEGPESFVAGGIVVHNCAPTTTYGASKMMAERVSVCAGEYGRTKFSAVRYGNVVGSVGSVPHVWRRQVAASAPIEITDPDSTRFWVTLPDAARFVLDCCQIMQGREVFVPRLLASRIADLADAVAPDTDRRIVGLRVGEKRHEVLVSPDEVDRTWAFVAPGVAWGENEYLRGYLIWPTAGTPDPAPYILERVPPDFAYSSGNAPRIPADKLRAMVEGALASAA